MNGGVRKPAKWNWKSGATWAGIAGGAIVGGVSGLIGGAVASSGIAFANTLSVLVSSSFNSAGMGVISKGNTGFSFSLGFASYDVTNNQFGYLGKKGNSRGENWGYALGSIGLAGDVLAGLSPKDAYLATHNDPEYVTPLPIIGNVDKDFISHTQIGNSETGLSLVDWGPAEDAGPMWRIPTNKYYTKMSPNEIGGSYWDAIKIPGANMTRIENYSKWLNNGNGGKYNLILNSCVSKGSRALNMSGIFNIGIVPGISHPYFLHAQMYLRFAGIRPLMFSQYLTR
jgi:hypothetical protein